MKKMSKTIFAFILGLGTSFAINVAAEAVISSGAVSYSNTTVSAALDELFSAVDINNKIGTTDISAIGDGTITGALATQQSQLNTHNNILNNVHIATQYTYQTNNIYLKIDASTAYSSVIIGGVSSVTVIAVQKDSNGVYRLHTTPSNVSIDETTGEICVNVGSWYANALIISARQILYTYSL